MPETLKQTADTTREQQTILGELQQQARSAFAVTVGKIHEINQITRLAEVFLEDENKKVSAIVAIHPDYTSMFSSLKVGDFVLVLHKAGLGALIILKIANDRNTLYTSAQEAKLSHGTNASTAGP
jgi:hypothetical protein